MGLPLAIVDEIGWAILFATLSGLAGLVKLQIQRLGERFIVRRRSDYTSTSADEDGEEPNDELQVVTSSGKVIDVRADPELGRQLRSLLAGLSSISPAEEGRVEPDEVVVRDRESLNSHAFTS